MFTRGVPYHQETTKKLALLICYVVSIEMEDNGRGQLVANESSCDVFEKALHMTHSREQCESACFEKRLWRCSLAFLINFLLTRLPHCISLLPKLFNKRTSGRNALHCTSPLDGTMSVESILWDDTFLCFIVLTIGPNDWSHKSVYDTVRVLCLNEMRVSANIQKFFITSLNLWQAQWNDSQELFNGSIWVDISNFKKLAFIGHENKTENIMSLLAV